MPNLIDKTCGTQHAETSEPPAGCAICQDERQFVGWSGQQWTNLGELRQSHENSLRLEDVGLYGINMEPLFAIGQPRARLVTRPEGKTLASWKSLDLRRFRACHDKGSKLLGSNRWDGSQSTFQKLRWIKAETSE